MCADMNPAWWEGSRARKESKGGAKAQGLLSYDNEHSEREPLTGDHAEHAFCSLWGGCPGRRPQSSASLALGVFRSSPLTCALVREHRQCKAEPITMPGSPQGQGQGQTDKPTGTSLLRGSKEAKQKETQKDKVRGKEVSLCSPSAGGLLFSKPGLLKLVFFCCPLHFRVPTQFLGQFVVLALDIKLKH